MLSKRSPLFSQAIVSRLVVVCFKYWLYMLPCSLSNAFVSNLLLMTSFQRIKYNLLFSSPLGPFPSYLSLM
uniref:Uncharacterized protein n=1 Tax=Siphoviridae sp. ctVqj4 TaxID=2826359 RepID=A0A8S5NLB7_9CAUD|nr:MAG TPA: hypothetical protein [Siphoviridae sp. ctVqj4]